MTPSARASLAANGVLPLDPVFQREFPDLSGFTGANGLANHPRALQREDRRDLYSETWGLTIEHELPAGFLFSTSYLGSHGVHLFSRGAVNLCSPGFAIFTDATGNPNCTRPLDQFFPGNPTTDPYGSVDFKHDVGLSSYNGLLVSLEKTFTNGLSFETPLHLLSFYQ